MCQLTKHLTVVLILVAFVVVGCNDSSQQKPSQTGPVQGTLDLEKLTPEQQIEKIRNDPSIPEQYKETYINSVRSKAQGGVR